MNIVAVIVTYNRLASLKRSIDATLAESVTSCLVVNNASTDGTQEWLFEQTDPRLIVVSCEENLGGAGGFNLGFKEAVETHRADWVVCYDDDAYPARSVISKFREKASLYDTQIGAVAAAVYSPLNTIVEMNRPGLRPFSSAKQTLRTLLLGRMGFHIGDDSYKDLPRAIYNASFVGFFVKADAINEVGYPRSELFIYGDDVLYSMDLADSGFMILFEPELKFVHDCKTIDRADVTYKPLWKAYYTYRNAVEIYRRESGMLFPIIIVSKSILWVSKVRHYKVKKVYLKLVFYSLYDGLIRDFSRAHNDVVKKFSYF